MAKIDFIICEEHGSWFFESHSIPESIAKQSNEEIVLWAKDNVIKDAKEYIYVGVYWRDPNV